MRRKRLSPEARSFFVRCLAYMKRMLQGSRPRAITLTGLFAFALNSAAVGIQIREAQPHRPVCSPAEHARTVVLQINPEPDYQFLPPWADPFYLQGDHYPAEKAFDALVNLSTSPSSMWSENSLSYSSMPMVTASNIYLTS